MELSLIHETSKDQDVVLVPPPLPDRPMDVTLIQDVRDQESLLRLGELEPISPLSSITLLRLILSSPAMV